jgi:outer membrane receptor protein involved in Fe transport
VDHADYRLQVDDGFQRAVSYPDFTLWSPKAALSYRILPPLAVYAAYARGFRLPNYDENAPLLPVLPGDPVLLPDLDPQTSDSGEVGLKFEGQRVQAGVAYYYMQVEDELIFDPVFPPFGSNVNFDEVIHQGVEVSFQLRPLEWLELSGSYTFEDVVVRDHVTAAFEDQRVPLNPRHRGSVGVLLELPYWLEAGWTVNVVGSRHLANDFAHLGGKLGRYAAHDLVFAFRPPLGEHVELALHAGVYNLGAEHYSDFGVRAFSFDVLDFAKAVNPQATRSWEIGLVLTVKR